MNWSRSIRPLRSWSVVVLGVALLGVTFGYMASGGTITWMDFVRTSLPIALSLATVALGIQVARTMTRPQCERVVLWCLVGGLVTVLVTDWIIFVERNAGRPLTRPVPMLASAVSVGFVGGGLVGVYSVRLRERTRELAERTDELLEKNDRLDEFSRIVSHDLRNPITVARGHLELARETGDPEHFETVRRAHVRMERLIQEVRTFTRDGVSTPEPEPVRLGAVAEAAWETSATRDAALEVESSRPILADERRLRTLFENLFRNSVEHSSRPPSPHEDTLSDGGAAVTVTVGATDAGFFVADDGSGIPVAKREQVFEAGYSGSDRGTGMGLSIVRSIVDSHGWDCRIVDSASGGSRFEFTGVDRPESKPS